LKIVHNLAAWLTGADTLRCARISQRSKDVP
jgi:hypothetical protein